jgi:hypothetical protein
LLITQCLLLQDSNKTGLGKTLSNILPVSAIPKV